MKHKKLFQALAVIPLTLSLAASGCSLLPKEAQDEIHKQLGAIQDEVDQQTEALQSQADKVVSQVQEVLPNPDQFQPRWDKTCTGSNSAFYGIGNQYGFAFIRPDGTVASEGFLDGVSSEMDTWCGVKQLALQYDGCATFGLLSDGTVSVTGELYGESLKKVKNWTDVEQLYPYDNISRLDAIRGMVGLSKMGNCYIHMNHIDHMNHMNRFLLFPGQIFKCSTPIHLILLLQEMEKPCLMILKINILNICEPYLMSKKSMKEWIQLILTIMF